MQGPCMENEFYDLSRQGARMVPAGDDETCVRILVMVV